MSNGECIVKLVSGMSIAWLNVFDARACVRACARVRACVRACVRVCVCVDVCVIQMNLPDTCVVDPNVLGM